MSLPVAIGRPWRRSESVESYLNVWFESKPRRCSESACPILGTFVLGILYMLLVPLWIFYTVNYIFSTIESPSRPTVAISAALALAPPAFVLAVCMVFPAVESTVALLTASIGGPFWLFYSLVVFVRAVRNPSAPLILLAVYLIGVELAALVYFRCHKAGSCIEAGLCCTGRGLERMRPRGWPRSGEDTYVITEYGPSRPSDSPVGPDSDIARGSDVGFKSGHPSDVEGCWTSDLESARVLDVEAVGTPDVEPNGTPEPGVSIISPGIVAEERVVDHAPRSCERRANALAGISHTR